MRIKPDEDASDTTSFVFEGTIVRGAIQNPAYLSRLDILPEIEDFDDDDARVFWEYILDAHRAGNLSRTGIMRRVREDHGGDSDWMPVILSMGADELTNWTDYEAAVSWLVDRRMMRCARRVARDFLNLDEGVTDAQGEVQRLERQVSDIASRSDQGDDWTAGEDVSSERAPTIETGWKVLDEKTGGIQLSVFTVLAGRPGMGKTAFAVDLAKQLAEQGHGVGFFSMEMPAYDLQCRMAASHIYQRGPMYSGTSNNLYYQTFMHDRLRDGDVQRMHEGLDAVRKLPIWYDDRNGLKPSQIRIATRRLKTLMAPKGVPLKAIIVDHIGHIRPDSNRNGNRVSELTDTTSALMTLARELDIAVIGLSQLSRAVEQRGDKRPMLADLRDSGSIEQDATAVYFLYRGEYYADKQRAEDMDWAPNAKDETFEPNTLEVIVAKQRNGPVCTVKMFCEIGANAILDRNVREVERVA